ncbi:Imm49 family immunity protein [Rhodanobacter terrae]|uniref:Imm49 family immunity protein n=1 Tax=Rhodanobacter terrae TaxID=418647 RepID=A0ABW0T0Z2_9GAMM
MSLNTADYAQSVAQGLPHVGAHLEKLTRETEIDLRYIDSNSGDPEACKTDRRRHAECASLIAWFGDQNLVSCKQWAYVAGKLDRILYQKNPSRGIWGALGERNAMLWPLLSDHPQLVAWFGAFDAIDVKRAVKGGTFEFETYQSKLALRGEWDKLGERSERFLADVPKRMERFAPDNRFHLALARGDVSAMESALTEMVTPQAIRWRTEHEGYTGWFIIREAVIYAKIAWRHGYQVTVDTPWIPAAWLPVAQLAAYHDPYPFMQTFDIDTPIQL